MGHPGVLEWSLEALGTSLFLLLPIWLHLLFPSQELRTLSLLAVGKEGTQRPESCSLQGHGKVGKAQAVMVAKNVAFALLDHQDHSCHEMKQPSCPKMKRS
jgi:hypothetical protein